MQAVAEKVERRRGTLYGGPAPAGFFLTSRVIDEVPILHASSLADRVRQILLAAETDLFRPLLSSARLNDFGQEFTLLANRYFPVRIQTLIIILNEVGLERFRTEYFNRVPNVAASLAMHAANWGLPADEVAAAFHQYFESGSKIIRVAPYLGLAPAANLLRLVSAMTEIDYGFTAMGLVLEGSIPAQPWRVAEVFRLTRRSLLEYEDAANSAVAHIEQMQPGQTEMFGTARQKGGKIVAVQGRSLGQAGKHLRSIGQPVKWPEGDPDSDYE